MYATTCKRSLERRQERGGGHSEKEEESLEREERSNVAPQTSPAHELQHIVRTFILKNPGRVLRTLQLLCVLVGKQIKSAVAFESAWFGLLLCLLISCFDCAIYCYVNTGERLKSKKIRGKVINFMWWVDPG